MKQFFLCVGLLGAAPFYLAAQQEVSVSHHTVSSYDLADNGMLTEKVYLKYKATPQVKLTHIQTEPVDQVPEGARKGNSFEPDIIRGTERKKPVAFVNIPPYRVANGKIEKLAAYDLELTQYDDGSDGPTARKPTTVDHSVLASGTWYKIAVPARGVYKMDYAFLQSLGVNPLSINPANIRVYGNGGTVLPEKVTDDQPDDLIENAIVVNSAGSTFGQNDYVLFYANGPTLWSKDSLNKTFKHTTNYYENRSYYFINFDQGPGKRIGSEAATGTAAYNVTALDDYALIEGDSTNLGQIGKAWWSYRMNSINSASLIRSMNVSMGPVSGPTVNITTVVGNLSNAEGNKVTLNFNGTPVKDFSLGIAPAEYTLIATDGGTFAAPAPGGNGVSTLQYRYFYAGTGAAYVDFARINYRRQPVFPGGQWAFRDWETTALATGENAAYTLQSAANLTVWDITNPLAPVTLQGSQSGSTYTFTRAGKSLKEFIAFDGSAFSTPVAIGTVANQDLHGLPHTDFLIVTSPAFKAAAEDLAAFHRQRDGITVTVVPTDLIYNEFSSGGQDIGGIRNFIKMFYDRADNEAEMIKNVLFMGAASYDYKDRLTFNTNFVPTFETENSTAGVLAYASDDFYALLDKDEDINLGTHQLDVGTGRIPAFDAAEAQNAVNKIKHYVSPASFGPWKNVVTYIADDQDTRSESEVPINHLPDCDEVNRYFYDSAQVYNVYKIYCDAYKQVNTTGGGRYPMVNKAIDDQIYNGTFLTSYSGHGSPDRWAHEAILSADDYGSWRNIDKLPVMVTATCDFGRFDDPEHRSAGARLSISPKGGSIAMITTTQVVFPGANRGLNRAYTRAQFSRDAQGKWRTLGEALATGKNTYNSDNNYRFVVLGDPALRMAMPEHVVATEKLVMQDGDDEYETDTLKALGRYVLSGFIKDNNGNVLDNFNGKVYVTAYDKIRTIQNVNPDQVEDPTFQLQTNVAAKVKGTVKDGKFSVTFVVPKDINYDYGKGKISYYADNSVTDASGLDTNFTVGGYNPNAEQDNDAPIVQPYIDNDKFRNGGVTGPDPLLYVKLYDDNGINISGTSVGHDLVGILDDDVQNPYIMNNYYESEQNDYRKGYVNFPLHNLPEGLHTLRVKAWDVYNNSGEGVVVFEVRNKDKGFISDLYNYPNPMKEITHFVFQHNQEGEQMDVTLMIYTTAGRLVKTIKENIETTGNRTEITWDGLGEGGAPLSKGVYFYKLHAKNSKGVTATAYQKLVLLR